MNSARRQNGQSIVELAFLLPILVLLGMVALAGAQLLSESIALRGYGREGALAAAAYVANPANSSSTDADVAAFVQQRVTTVGGSTNVTLTVSPKPTGSTCNVSGSTSGICLMTVKLSEIMYPVQNFFGGINVQYTASAAIP